VTAHHAARVAIGLACALGLCAHAHAQDETADEPETTEATPNVAPSAITDNDTPPVPEHEANASLVTPGTNAPPKTDNESVQTLGPFERLPPSAYPEPRVRGIRGGSLWMTFHGLQWPYYPRTGIGVSGYVWVDTGYERVERGNPSEQGIKYLLQQGRLLLRVTPTYTNGDFFVQGEAELVANKDQSLHQPDIVDADDVWVRAGMWNRFDVQLGRFEGWEIYHMGMGLDLNTLERQGATDDVFGVPDIYGVTYAFYRPLGVGQVAAHLYPTDFLRFELGTQIGNEFGSNTLAARPVAILDFGWIKLKGGVEYKQLTDQKDGAQGETKRRGGGGALQFVIDPRVEFGVNAAYGLVDKKASDGTVDEKGSITVYSIGGFANARIVGDLLVGVGANITKQHDIHYDAMLGDYGRFSHLQTFVAVQYMLLEQLYLKAVFAYAKGEFHPNFGDPVFDNTMLSGRVRLLYLF
jgi:hypothetical protein